MTLKSAARRGVALGLAGCAALALSACGAGQIAQTANQVAAVDGASAQSDDDTIAVRDVTVVVNDDSTAALKFTAVNQDPSESTHTLESVTVGGEQVTLSEKPKLERECVAVADSKEYMDKLTKPEAGCVTHISTSLENNGLALGGTKDVVFNFNNGEVTVSAPIAGNLHKAGQVERTTGAESGDAHSHSGHSH